MSRPEFKAQQEIMKQLDAIIDSSYDGLWVCDSKGKVMRINSASEKINSIKADQVIGKKMQDLVHERYEILYKALGIEGPELPCYACYYATIDIRK